METLTQEQFYQQANTSSLLYDMEVDIASVDQLLAQPWSMVNQTAAAADCKGTMVVLHSKPASDTSRSICFLLILERWIIHLLGLCPVQSIKNQKCRTSSLIYGDSMPCLFKQKWQSHTFEKPGKEFPPFFYSAVAEMVLFWGSHSRSWPAV